MSHIHVPDGFLPVWLWLSGFLVLALLLGIVSRVGQGTAQNRRFALLGVFAALMVLAMSIHVPPFPYHFNLSVVSAIVLGPALAVMAAFIVNLVLAFLGHGGLTVVGVNALVLSLEMLVGYGVFRGLRALRLPLLLAGFLAVVIGLAAGTAGSYGVIAAGAPTINRNISQITHTEEADHAGEEAGHDEHGEHDHNTVERAAEGGRLDLTRLAVIMFSAGLIGWLLEGLLSTAILSAMHKLFPELFSGNNVEPETEARV